MMPAAAPATMRRTGAPLERDAARPERASLAWSEQMLLLCAALAMFLVVIRFLLPPLDDNPLIKHLPLALTLPFFVLTLMGSQLSPRPGSGGVIAAAWPLALLALIIVGGAAYARVVNQVQASFLNMGLYMSLLFVGATVVTHSAAPGRLAHAYCRILLMGALVMALGLIVFFRRREVYHEEIFLVIPLAVYAFLAWRHVLARWVGLIFFLALALLSAKNTSYLVAFLTAAYLAMLQWWHGVSALPPLHRVWRGYVTLVALTLVALAVAYLLLHRETYLPSGNVDYRSHTYGLAWRQFLDSPAWGTWFTAQGVQKFTLYTVGSTRNLLPTHSDVMDLLANGGVLGIALWFVGLFKIAHRAWRCLLAPRWRAHPWAPYAHTLTMISLAAVVTYAFNPIMLQPGMAYLMWLSLGFLLGLALRSDAASLPEEASCNTSPSRDLPGKSHPPRR